MAFPLTVVLAAAPGIISAAADIIKLIRHKQPADKPQLTTDDRIDELVTVIEKQAVVIEELARNNSQLALAVRNNRLLSISAICLAILATILAVLV